MKGKYDENKQIASKSSQKRGKTLICFKNSFETQKLKRVQLPH